MHWETRIFVTYNIAIVTLLWWSGTKLAVSPEYACFRNEKRDMSLTINVIIWTALYPNKLENLDELDK